MTKVQKLEEIAKEIKRCKTCKKASSGMAVPGEGNSDAKIVFLGEAPGRTEAATGRPFVGRSGKFLRSMISAAGLREQDVYITSPVKYLPNRGTPDAKQIAHGKTHLDRQLAVINPKYIVLLGNTACKAMLTQRIASLSDHGNIRTEGGRTYFITIHPAAVIRFPKYRKIFEEDFKNLKRLISNNH